MSFRTARPQPRAWGRLSIVALALGIGAAVWLTAGLTTDLTAPLPPTFTITSAITAYPGCSGATQRLYPGVQRCLTYTVSNPNTVPIDVTSLGISGVTSSAPSTCSVSPVAFSGGTYSGSLSVPASGTSATSVPIKWLDNGNQDGCEGATFNFAFTGTATYVDSTTTALTSSPNPSSLGQQVIYTATVTPTISETSTPAGSVAFDDGLTPITCAGGSQTFNGSTATCLVTYASSGTHSITAVYTNTDGNFSGSTSNMVTQQVSGGAIGSCSSNTNGATVITGTYNGNYVVANGHTVWLDGGTIKGNIQVDSAGQFVATGGTITGNLESLGGSVSLQGTKVGQFVLTSNAVLGIGPGTSVAGFVEAIGGGSICIDGTPSSPVLIGGFLKIEQLRSSSTPSTICSANVSGNVRYQSNGSPVLIGGSSGCSGNTVGGNLRVKYNTAKVTIGGSGTGLGNSAHGNIRVQGNAGGGTLTYNAAGLNCRLQSNTPVILGSANTARYINTCNNTAPTVKVTYPVAGTTYGTNWTGTISGTASSNAGAGTSISGVAVAIENITSSRWWNGTSFAATSQTFEPTTGTSTWTLGLGASKLTSGDRYSVIDQASDNVGDVGTTSPVTFTFNASAPTVKVTYPVTGTAYGSNWTGTITGTAASDSGASLSSTTVAIENTTSSLWWNGTSFVATSQTFELGTGTASWTRALAKGNLTSADSYSVVGRATDSVGNVGTSSTVSFTYNTAGPTAKVTYPVTGTTYGTNWTGTISGTASSNAGAGTSISSAAVAVENTSTGEWWGGSSFNQSSKTFEPASGTASWALALSASKLTSADSYSVVGQAVDSAGNVGTSSMVTFTYNTTAPTAKVTYPVTGTSYGSNWTGTISGTASSNAGAGTSISAAAVAIENTSIGKWWGGSSFNQSSKTFEPASGTTSWTLALAASKLTLGDSYSVIGRATDTAGNVGTSSTVIFTYNTAAPTVKVTFPVTGTTYATWTGTIKGTASSNAGSGASISSAAVAVENTSTDEYWGGSSFNQSSQTFEPATGTASWTLALAASKLTSGDSYTVIGQATDSAGNVGTSSTISFKYKT